MSKFDTHGGYFAPKDYMRVNEGGSHEENPNGGVQIGVDPEGNPNLLEEGEPVYKDYVYSDNIEAEREFLEQNHLPTKYEGKLYSKIADDLFTEAEERPLDPISRNGLEVLLGRLADAQEGQKQAKAQRDLEDELAQLSPEELDQLEQMLAQQEITGTDAGSNGAFIGAEGEPGIPPEQVMGPAEQVPVEGMPMMADGGTLLRRFDVGGPLTEEQKQAIIEQGPLLESSDIRVPSLLEIALGSDNKVVLGVDAAKNAIDNFSENTLVGRIGSALIPEDATQAFGSPLMRQAGRTLGPIGRSIGRGVKKIGRGIKKLPGKLIEAKGRGQMIEEAGAAVREAREASAAARSSANAIATELENAKAALAASPTDRVLMQRVADLEAKSARADVDALRAAANSVGTAIGSAGKTVGAVTTGPLYNRAALEKEISGLRKAYESAKAAADASPKDKALQEAAEAAQKLLEKAESGWNKWWHHGEWQYKGAAAGAGIGYGVAAGNKGKKSNWVERQLGNGGNLFWPGGPYSRYTDPNYAGYLYDNAKPYMYDPEFVYQAEIPLTVQGTYEQTHGGAVANAPVVSSAPVATSRSTSRTSSRTSSSSRSAQSAAPVSRTWYDAIDPSKVLEPTYVYEQGLSSPNLYDIVHDPNPAGIKIVPRPIVDLQGSDAVDISSIDKNSSSEEGLKRDLLPTWPRYAGAIGSGLLGLYDVFQQPDRYVQARINPELPEGRINLQNQVYNPVDQNMVANAQIAQGNATNRALRNSGLGPSSAAAILAADNNLTGNLGTGFLQAWDANNQRRNAVIAANNQAEAQRAQFDYTVDAARKQALNDAQVRNVQNNLLIQRLNNEAEGEKYQSISNQISNGLQALSGIGQENFAMNQINTNPAFIGYGTGANGGIYYNPLTGRMEIIPQIPDGTSEKKANAPKKNTTYPVNGPLFNSNVGNPFRVGMPMGYIIDPITGKAKIKN